MSNALFCWPDRLLDSSSYRPVLSGGSWSSSFPLANLKNTQLSKRARSANCLAASTQFVADMGTARGIRAIAFLRHNASSAGTVRVRSYSDAGLTTLVWDSTALSFWPEGYPAAEDKKRYQEDFYLLVPANTAAARYWLAEISDTSNPAGYIELGRAMFAPGFAPTVNIDYGASIGIETDTSSKRSDGGVDFWKRKEPRRIIQGTLSTLNETEAFTSVFDMMWDRGIDKEILFIFDPDDTGVMLKRRSWLATIKQLSPLQFPYFDNYSHPFQLQEVL